ncbi:hypothetical protein AB0D59_04570 [Streptomyces sp. NPDC048417]|uniref:hypothetical protein n=1 Tax=Streptomyces sp. NPDC048417 TaxID=3155387 RepID=UPI003448DA32
MIGRRLGGNADGRAGQPGQQGMGRSDATLGARSGIDTSGELYGYRKGRERVDLGVVVGEDAEGGDDLLAEILVLVVAPDHDDVRLELVEGLLAPVESGAQPGTVPGGGSRPFVVAPFLLGQFGPVLGDFAVRRDVGVLQRRLQQVRHVRVGAGQHRVMRQAKTEHFCHAGLLQQGVGRFPVHRRDPGGIDP